MTCFDSLFKPQNNIFLFERKTEKAEKKLGWKREISFQELVERMVKNDLALVEKEIKVKAI